MEINSNLLQLPVLGLTIEERTAKCSPSISWPAGYHLDPDFITWLIAHPQISFEQALSQVPEIWWHKIESPADLKIAEKKLLKNIQNKTEGWVAPRLNKPISFAISRRLVRTPITPNQITSLNLVLAFLAFWLLTSLYFPVRILGAFLMQFSSIVDGCDGEVARLKLMSSKFGAWFDTCADDIANNLFFCGVFLGLWKSGYGKFYYWGGWITLVASVGVTLIIYQQLIRKKKGANAKDFNPTFNEGKKGSWFDLVRPVMKRDFFVVVMLVFFVLDWRVALFWISALGTWATFCVYAVSLVMEFKARRQ